MIRRLILILSAVALVLATAAQVIPRASAMDAGMAHSVEMPSDCATAMSGSAEPCKEMAPKCIDLMGCALVAIAEPPVFSAIPVLWGDVAYSADEWPLSGRSVKPDLTPPILQA